MIDNPYPFLERPYCHARENGHPGLDSLFPTAPLLRSLDFVGAQRGNDTLRYLFAEVILIGYLKSISFLVALKFPETNL